MKTNVQSTSIKAYRELDDLGERQRQVYDTLAVLGAASNLDIAESLRMPINAITPRMNELVKLGFARQSYKDISRQTGKTVIFWEVVPQDQTQRRLL